MSELIAVSTSADEARRVMSICNACRYCEGLCTTFKAMTDYREFAEADLDHLANICHNCSACFYDCQYAPPHELAANVPVTLTAQRLDSYRRYAWPSQLAVLYHRNGLTVTLLVGFCLGLILMFATTIESGLLFGEFTGSGAFYQLVSHNAMILLGGTTFGYALVALLMGGRNYWRALDAQQINWAAWRRTAISVLTLHNLNGGHGAGCEIDEQGPSQQRRYFHHATMWGFLFCLASTLTATAYHYVWGLVAPYPIFSVPVILGTVGGVGLIVGPIGLLNVRAKMNASVTTTQQNTMDQALLVSLLMVSATGLLLLMLRETVVMGSLLLIHLGFVLGFFLSIPYSKFVHGLYRFLSLLAYESKRK